jgi:hypothetical protein
LSFDCCYDAVATQGANNLFAVESLANANKRRITRKRKGATGSQHVSRSSLPVRASAPGPEALEYLSQKRPNIGEQILRGQGGPDRRVFSKRERTWGRSYGFRVCGKISAREVSANP